jgi:glutamate synthase domain-containing protein 1
LFIKNPVLEPRLGELLARMLLEMTDRGPDSAGVAFYRQPVAPGWSKVTVLDKDDGRDFGPLADEATARFGAGTSVTPRASHAVIRAPAPAGVVQAWLHDRHPDLFVTSSGEAIEIFKEKGSPRQVAEIFGLDGLEGTHALGHTRMATESAVTTEHSHPFSTGLDLCLVHNGSLSNHNRLRETLTRHGIVFRTDNDSEVAAGYLTWRLSLGDSLEQALSHALDDLDGFYTFAIGSRDGFAVLRDPIGCKPAVMAETDDWVAMASEFRAIACLPGVDDARIGEPEPARLYTWEREPVHA